MQKKKIAYQPSQQNFAYKIEKRVPEEQVHSLYLFGMIYPVAQLESAIWIE